MLIEIRGTTPQQTPGLSTWFAGGFRPFFLLCGLYALAPLVWWVASLWGAVAMPAGWSPMVWHGHEMLFGFVMAAVAGFLLTAVPKWTQSRALTGGRLAMVVGTWLVGRIAMWGAGSLSPELVALCDLLFLPALGFSVAPPILKAVRAGQPRNVAFPIILAVLFVANLLTHLESVGDTPGLGRVGIKLAVYLMVTMVTILAGRLVPSFTRNALQKQEGGKAVEHRVGLEPVVLASVVCAAIADLLEVSSLVTSVFALVAAALLTVRCAGWRMARCGKLPIVLILHVGHLWIILGFLLVGLSGFVDSVPWTSGLHAFTAGAMGTMILAVMTRAALGHSGRALEVHAAVVVAYALVVVGGLVRVVVPMLGSVSTAWSSAVAGILWAGAFALFSVVYWPILTKPRIDGRPG